MQAIVDEKKLKEQIKNIKKLNTSILIGLPNIPDMNSSIISKIGVLYGGTGDVKKQ